MRAVCRVARLRRTFEWRVERDPLRGGDRRSQAIEARAPRILALVAAKPDSTLEELKAALGAECHTFSISALRGYYAISSANAASS